MTTVDVVEEQGIARVRDPLESSDSYTPLILSASVRAIKHIVFRAVVTPLQSP
ncbi:hypothetical protein BSU04_09170 [Caballeronia sordidicola]|uniref:Uncharacterized protein n=1 Tax=Caballeronia sordidicola TaxID=196367 RepID=A0A226X7P8_CABSO|nr:hypothetical protein BSU04_09170 [Caballeronia sordidicola]